MQESYEVAFLDQKVFHDGTSMIVAKKGDKKEVATRLIQTFVDEGVIKPPKAWVDDLAGSGEAAEPEVKVDATKDQAPADAKAETKTTDTKDQAPA